MSATREQLIKAAEKSRHSPKTGKHGKRWRTIAIEKAREEYLKKLENHFDELTSVHLKAAKNPKNIKERIYAIDQTIGKAKETIEHIGEVELKLNW